MDELFPLIVITVIISSIVSSAKKEKAKKSEEARRFAAAASAARKQQDTADMSKAREAAQQRQASVQTHRVPESTLQPQVHAHIKPDCATHDVPGSLGVTSMEGKDPCHEDELTLERTFAEPVQQSRGLSFDWTGDSMVKAVVMQEVLTRPSQRIRR